MDQLIVTLSMSLLIDFLLIFYVYRKKGNGIVLRIILILLLSSNVITLTNALTIVYQDNIIFTTILNVFGQGINNISLLIFAIYYIIKYITDPVEKLVSINEQMAEGNLNIDINV